MNKGALVVIDGIDGSGKTTQINLLSKILKQKGKAFEVISFPQYGKNEYADYIYDYLSTYKSTKSGSSNTYDANDALKDSMKAQLEKFKASQKLALESFKN